MPSHSGALAAPRIQRRPRLIPNGTRMRMLEGIMRSGRPAKRRTFSTIKPTGFCISTPSFITKRTKQNGQDEQCPKLQAENRTRPSLGEVQQKRRAHHGDERGDGSAVRSINRDEREVQDNIYERAECSPQSCQPGETFRDVISALHDADEDKGRRPTENSKHGYGRVVFFSEKERDEQRGPQGECERNRKNND